MKKYLIYILIFVLILIPIKTYAVEITNTEITGVTEKNIGEEFILDFKIDLTELEKKKTLGVWLVSFELIFDDKTLILSDISSNEFNSYIYNEGEKYYVISEVIENSSSNKICSNKILHCGNYEVSIKFYIKNTELTETTIKMNEVEIGLLDITEETKIYTTEDLITLNDISNNSHTLKINKISNEIKEEPKSITTYTKPIINKQKTIINAEDKKSKSSNAFIKELKINNYDIEFEKNKTNYILTIEENINELDFSIKLENENATYKIIGADDLKSNNNEIAIIVTAEDGSTITYTVNVKYNELIKEKNNKVITDFKDLIKKYFTKDNLTLIGIILGIIIIIILIIILINKRQNKKINKLLGEL